MSRNFYPQGDAGIQNIYILSGCLFSVFCAKLKDILSCLCITKIILLVGRKYDLPGKIQVNYGVKRSTNELKVLNRSQKPTF